MKRTRTCSRSAFTLIELMVVIVVIMVLVGILMPTIYGTKKQAKERQAKAEIIALEAAIVNYKFQNREWPADKHDLDTVYKDDNRIVINKLIKPPDQRPPLLDVSDFRMDSKMNVLDPWGSNYVIRLDTDYDGYRRPDPAKTNTVSFVRGVLVESVNL